MKPLEESNVHNELCVGIDLGTTNSVLATINVRPNGNIVSKVVDIPRAVDVYNSVSAEAKLSTMKKPTLPSCIYYRQEKGYEPLVGDFAKIQYALRPHLVAKSIKSQMGKPLAEGLSPDIPDKTPAQISSRVLQHMLREAEKVYKCHVTEAVITVPANFDSAMCKATRDAAELAGITVRNKDGSERPVLLSEPNAVIYDLINQIHNGEISDQILDLSTSKRVLVFDLGGGTLDITMHEIRKRGKDSDVLKVDEISTNRYTLLGGDDFDEAIAEEMYNRYQKQYARNASVVALLRQKKDVIMAQLRTYAENVKLDLSMQCTEGGGSTWGGWDDDDDEVTISTGGSMGGIGYPYDDNFTKAEIEAILAKFMGNELKYADYKRISTITQTRNIIYPILDVLSKAAEKLKLNDIKVDAVIVNGGMSKFYMVTNRLKQFFGFDPIVALDPDQSVARGAAVYHHLLRQHSELQDDMKRIGDDPKKVSPVPKKPAPKTGIDITLGTILNDALYLGLKNDEVQLLVPTGASLPYESKVMTGFWIDPNQNRIDIPIRSRNLDGTYRTIASGIIRFSQLYPNGSNVSFMICMSESKVITLKAWTSQDKAGRNRIEAGNTDISIGDSSRSQQVGNSTPNVGGNTINGTNKNVSDPLSNNGVKLNAPMEITTLVRLCKQFTSLNPGNKASTISQQIRECQTRIVTCANRSDFAKPILSNLRSSGICDEARTRLFVLSRRICVNWTSAEKNDLVSLCIQQLMPDLRGITSTGAVVNTNTQAIYTLSITNDKSIANRIVPLHKKYKGACLYTHAKTQTELKWIIAEFESDAKNAAKKLDSSLQISAHAIAMAMANNSSCVTDVATRTRILRAMLDTINSGRLSYDVLIVCVIALGLMCDTRTQRSPFTTSLIQEVTNCLKNLDLHYPNSQRTSKNRDLSLKLIRGEHLSVDEERFLLTKLEI